MSSMRNIAFFLLIMLGALLGITGETAAATNSFSVTMTNFPLDLTMGDLATNLTYSIVNNINSNGNITKLQFTAPTGFTWQGCASLPSGWTCGAGGGNSITITAGTVAVQIVPGGTLPVTLTLGAIPSLGGDNLTGTLASIKATFSKNPKNVTRNTPVNTFPRVHALLMTLVPSATSVTLGNTFTLMMTVTNKSTVTQNTIVSSPSPPTKSVNIATTSSTPASLSLAPGTTGTMIWTYTATTAGAVFFTATATNAPSGGAATSKQVSSVVVTIGIFIASITATPNCLYSGGTATFTMIVTNSTGVTVTFVKPSPALTRYGVATIGAFTGPNPTSISSLASGVTGTFIWTAPVTGNVQDTFYVTGYATSSIPTYTTATVLSNTLDINGYSVAAVDPPSTNAGSTMQNLAWSITNYGCSSVTNNPTNINQVAFSVPAGWTAPVEGYALVTNMSFTQVDTWTLAGTTFTSPSAPENIPGPGSVGNFELLFPATPASAGTSTFTITVTDDTGASRTVLTTVAINPYNTGGLNNTGTGIWHEEVR